MRKALLGILCVFSCTMSAQDYQLFNADKLPQSLLFNPGENISFDKHLGIPLLSGIGVHAGITGVTVHDIFQENDSNSINDRIREAILSMNNKDFISATQRLEVLSYGWRKNDIYFSAGMYEEVDVINYFPKDLAVLGYEGNANYINERFDFADAKVRAEALTVYHFGVNKSINEKLTVGARVKVYNSIINATSLDNEGSFITRTTPNGPNFYSHDIENADVRIYTSGTNGVDDLETDQILGNILFSGNMGLGIDLGFDYDINYQWSVSGSLVDIGFIRHHNNVKLYNAHGTYSLNGIEFIIPSLAEGSSFTPYFENLQDEFEDQVYYGADNTRPYTTLRPVKLYAALNYNFGLTSEPCDCLNPDTKVDRFQDALGVQLYAIKRPRGPQAAITAFLDKRINSFLRTKVTYTIDPYSYSNIGVLLDTRINTFNFYLAVDNLLALQNVAKANNTAFQLGFQFVL